METRPSAFADRASVLKTLRAADAKPWDLVIVGGGITGAGVLREAARRGYRALLVEQQDFSWGTSSRSSKMVHGGLRYLAQGDIRLTRESLTERERLLREAPGLVERLGYYFVLRRGAFPNRYAMKAILTLYDWIAGVRDNSFCSPEALEALFPGLATDGLSGASYYTDAVTDDSRLTLRVLQEAQRAGGVALNYLPVKTLLKEAGQVKGVVVQDPDGMEEIPVQAAAVISATGAWADRLRGEVTPETRIRPLRGSHLVLPQERLPAPGSLTFMHPQDKRAVFIFPWEGTTVVGTTDLDHGADLNTEASITQQEVEYLLAGVHRQFPHCTIGPEDVISTWAGVRPVIGSDGAKDPSRERRDHAVWSDTGLITVSGGKLTTFRVIAQDALKAAAPRLPPPTPSNRDAVFDAPDADPATLVPEDPEWGKRLLGRYGALAADVLGCAPEAERARIAGTQVSLTECRWAIRAEAVRHLDDLLLRRTRLGQILPLGGAALFGDLAGIFAQEAGWDAARWKDERARYERLWRQHYSLPAA